MKSMNIVQVVLGLVFVGAVVWVAGEAWKKSGAKL